MFEYIIITILLRLFDDEQGVAAPQTFALDLLHDLLAAWSHMFRSVKFAKHDVP